MARPAKLPIGIQAFETIRENGYLYVDKTRHVFRMIDEGMFYFLARPRRFGKSLLVSTLKCLFQGRRELFHGLWLGDHAEWDWKPYPIILMDFNGITHDTPENLKLDLERTLVKTAATHGVNITEPLLKGKFKELLLSIFEKTGRPVVVLVDEYDKPIIDHLGKGKGGLQTARLNRDIMKDFWGVLKDIDVSPALRFVFLTGVSKFSRVSIFSELNNLDDLTMSRFYAEMLGYTDAEMTSCFCEHIDLFSQETGQTQDFILTRLKQQYDGYRFSQKEVTVYNPFSVLKALHHMAFQQYWFETGTPTFLVNLMREKGYYFPALEGLEVTESVFSTYDLDNLKPEALLFQTGYLTISRVNRLYTLNYPNQEVRHAFLENLFRSLVQDGRTEESSKFALLTGYLDSEDFNAFFETITAIFASIPYSLETKRDEAYFHTLFYLMVSASGMDARSEILTCRGRIDLAVIFPDKVFLMEFKCDQDAKTGIQQIRNKGYAEPYLPSRKKVFLMGIDFSSQKRNLADWKVEEENTVNPEP